MIWLYLIAFFASLLLALVITPLVIKLAILIGAVDNPNEATRKIHERIMPRAGGIVIATIFVVLSLTLTPGAPTRAYWGALLASMAVFLVGLYDDVKRLSPWTKLVAQITSALVAILIFGVGVEVISNPLGQQFDLVSVIINVGDYAIPIVAVLFSLLWMVGMTNTMNFLDGLDGLATGVGAIASFILFLVSVNPRIDQPSTAVLALILLGACLGFLRYNFYPAKIFLGDSGAYFLGMMLGSLAVISGAKLATALLVLGVPVIDAMWSVVRRLAKGKSPFTADRGHFHYILLDAGLSQKQAVLLIYALSLAFGLFALMGSGLEKLLALLVLVVVVAMLMITFTLSRKRQHRRSNLSKD
jgi:UDP-GlcNAc:undecaprenyl-phosphate GlcNAc-1-phosphate transferase